MQKFISLKADAKFPKRNPLDLENWIQMSNNNSNTCDKPWSLKLGVSKIAQNLLTHDYIELQNLSVEAYFSKPAVHIEHTEIHFSSLVLFMFELKIWNSVDKAGVDPIGTACVFEPFPNLNYRI